MKRPLAISPILLLAVTLPVLTPRVEAAGSISEAEQAASSVPVIPGEQGNARCAAAPLPPLGWNSWNWLYKNPTEKAVREMADAMVSSGMKDAGYQYIVIDDFWEYGRVSKPGRPVEERPGRDAQGILLADPVRFPNGIQALADYVHGKGLKFGIYTSPGESTCGCNTGSYGHLETDLNTFAEWGVDFIKLDMCGHTEKPEDVLAQWRAGINRLKRPIVLSVNVSRDFGLTRRYADMWRTTADLMNVFHYPPGEFRTGESVCSVIDQQVGLEKYSGHGRWNDPDMLRVGCGKLTLDECRVHFGMWAILAAPIMAGNDLRTLTPEIRDILINREVLAIDQDPAGRQGYLVLQPDKDLQVWLKPLEPCSQIAVALLNRGTAAKTYELSLAALGIHGRAFFRDLFAHQDLGLHRDSFTTTVPAHGIRLFKVSTFEFLTPPPAYVPPALDFSRGPARVEAEDGTRVLFYAGSVTNGLPHFSGEGYAQGSNTWTRFRLRFSLPIARAGNYLCSFRYQNPGAFSVQYKLDDVPVDFVPTRKGEWQTAKVAVHLKAGMNIVQLSSARPDQNEMAIDGLDLQAP